MTAAGGADGADGTVRGPAPARLEAACDFLAGAAALKDTLRSGFTPAGRPESVAEHSWRLGLLALVLAGDMEGVDLGRLLCLILVHDLGEAISGDVPAIRQVPGDGRAARERADLEALCAPLPSDVRDRILALADEYAAARTPEAVMAKGLDKCETMLTHAEGANPADFDYAWNLGYGTDATARTPLLAALREVVDARTRARMEG